MKYRCLSLGILVGNTEGEFEPSESVTRVRLEHG